MPGESKKGAALNPPRIKQLQANLKDWKIDGKRISKTFKFEDFYETMAFVNAVAWIANRENHHPDLEVGYNRCAIHYTTHSVGGLSEKDFVCAAQVDALTRT